MALKDAWKGILDGVPRSRDEGNVVALVRPPSVDMMLIDIQTCQSEVIIFEAALHQFEIDVEIERERIAAALELATVALSEKHLALEARISQLGLRGIRLLVAERVEHGSN